MDDSLTDSAAAPLPLARPARGPAGAPVAAAPPSPLDYTASRRDAFLELALVLSIMVLTQLPLIVGDVGLEPHQYEEARRQVPIQVCVSGAGLLVVIRLLLARNGQSLASIGLTTGGPARFTVDVLLGIGCAVAFVLTTVAVSIFIQAFRPDWQSKLEESGRNIQQVFPPMDVWQIAAMMTIVALYEEVLFRGFILTRVRRLVRWWWLAILICSIGFALLHGYQSGIALPAIAGLGMVFSVILLWRRSLVAPIVAHFLFNFAMMTALKFASEATPP